MARRYRVVAALAAVCLSRIPAAADAVATTTVVVVNSADVAPRQLSAALAVTRRLFDRAGIAIDCTSGVAAPLSGRSTAFHVYLVDHQVWPADIMGTSDPPSRTAWVLVGNVEHAVRAADADPAVILGHVVAHELGHLLLGRREHSVSGLMTATLSLTLAEQGVLTFHHDEIRRMIAGLTRDATDRRR